MSIDPDSVSRVSATVGDEDTMSHSSDHNTFHNTAIGNEEEKEQFLGDPVEATKYLKLPNGYDVVAIRETLLSEAPFVSRGNRSFWRRMMDSPQFEAMLTCYYHHIIGCISETGIVHEEKMVDIHESPLVESISNNFADVFFGASRHERDLFIPKLPELLCYMTLNALQAAMPKHQRLYASIQFREILIDWGSEMFAGVRQSHTRVGKEWIFADCNEMRLVTTSRPSMFTQAMDTQSKRAKSQYPLNSIGSSYLLDHCPLIELYIQRNNKSCNLIKNKLRVTLSHFPSRPLTTLQPGLLKSVRFRERKTDDKEIRQAIKRSNSMRRSIMTEFDGSNASFSEDMHRMKEALKTKLRVLANVKVSRKQEYAAAKAGSAGSGGSITGGGGTTSCVSL
jgi:hypothetical protein